MASVYKAGPDLRRFARGMAPGLLDRLSQAELDARLVEMARLHKQAESLPGVLARERVDRARRVRDALPWPEYQEKMAGFRKQLGELPGTGHGVLSLRQSLWKAIVKLKAANPYPDGVGEQLKEER